MKRNKTSRRRRSNKPNTVDDIPSIIAGILHMESEMNGYLERCNRDNVEAPKAKAFVGKLRQDMEMFCGVLTGTDPDEVKEDDVPEPPA